MLWRFWGWRPDVLWSACRQAVATPLPWGLLAAAWVAKVGLVAPRRHARQLVSVCTAGDRLIFT